MSIEKRASPYQGPSDLNKVYSVVASRPGGLSYRGNGIVRNLTKPFGQQRDMKHPHITELYRQGVISLIGGVPGGDELLHRWIPQLSVKVRRFLGYLPHRLGAFPVLP